MHAMRQYDQLLCMRYERRNIAYYIFVRKICIDIRTSEPFKDPGHERFENISRAVEHEIDVLKCRFHLPRQVLQITVLRCTDECCNVKDAACDRVEWARRRMPVDRKLIEDYSLGSSGIIFIVRIASQIYLEFNHQSLRARKSKC